MKIITILIIQKKIFIFFKQNHLPLIDTEGQILIDKDYHVKKASDGSGSAYNSLKKRWMSRRYGKKEELNGFSLVEVDNILLKQTDPVLLGMAIYKNSQIASKTILKSYPDEKVGIFCSYDKHPRVIEYSEMPREIAYELTNDNELKYKEAHIMCNLYTLDALKFFIRTKITIQSSAA